MTRSSLSLAAVLLLVTACTPSSAARNDSASPEQTLALALQQETVVDGVSLQFVGYRDHRCPTDVTCVWAGEAHAFVWVAGPGIEPQVVSLPWSGGGGDTRPQDVRRVGPYALRLRSLEPRPRADGATTPGDYRVVLVIERADAP